MLFPNSIQTQNAPGVNPPGRVFNRGINQAFCTYPARHPSAAFALRRRMVPSGRAAVHGMLNRIIACGVAQDCFSAFILYPFPA